MSKKVKQSYSVHDLRHQSDVLSQQAQLAALRQVGEEDSFRLRNKIEELTQRFISAMARRHRRSYTGYRQYKPNGAKECARRMEQLRKGQIFNTRKR